MSLVIVALTLFAILMAADADAETDAERLAEATKRGELQAGKFSPMLILAQESGGQWGGIRATQIDSSTVKVDTSSRASRTARKLAIGALWGIVPSYASGLFLTLATGNTQGFGAGLFLQFTVALGYPLGVAAGVSRVDPSDRFIHSVAGSGVGLLANFAIPITDTYEFSAFDWDVIWNWFVCPLVGATIASELGRDSNESRRFSIDVVPRPGALSAVAKVRF